MQSGRKSNFVFGVFEDSGKLAKALREIRIHVPTRANTVVVAGEKHKASLINFGGGVNKGGLLPDLEEKIILTGKYRKYGERFGGPGEATGPAVIIKDLRKPGTLHGNYEYSVPLSPHHAIVGFKSPRADRISDLLRKYGAVEVHIGNAATFRKEAGGFGKTGGFGEISTVLADMVEGVATREGSGSGESVWSVSVAPERPGSPPGYSDSGYVVLAQVPFEQSLEETKGAISVTGGKGETAPSQLPVGGGGGGPRNPVERFIEGRFPRSVRFGEKCYLEIRISVQVSAGAQSSPVKQGVLPEGKAAAVLLLLFAPDFAIQNGGRDRTVEVPPAGSSEFVLWELKPDRTGVCELSVTAYYSGVPIGALSLKTTVDVGVKTGPSEAQSADASFRKESAGAITLVIHYESDKKVYRYDFISAAGAYIPDLYAGPLKDTPESAIGALIEELNVVAKGKAHMDGPATRDWLRGKGAELWTEFIPQDLQDRFWQEREKIKKIRVLSSGDPVPWELLYPSAPGQAPDENAGFLGEAFTLTRWRFGPAADPRLNNGPVCFVLPKTAPRKAVAEISRLKEIVGANSETVGNLTDLGSVLKTGEFGILHFACHNLFELKQFGSRISLPDGPFEPSTLVNYKNKFRRPFVFMNACRTDGVAPSYTRLTGWADKFLDTGAGAFVGSLWEVRDESAARFAETFYGKLFDKTPQIDKTLGGAMKAARESIGNIGGDPTWLAYSAYGDADAALEQRD